MRFFVTTPIYYVNDIPHIGHAYTTVAADILSRYNRLKGNASFFLTGTDEHGQKVEQAAAAKGKTPKAHADLMVENYKRLWEKLNIKYDGFIRTTDNEHIKVVQELLQRLLDKGEIEKRSYSGWYCTPDERFWTEKDLIEGKCPDCGRDVEKIEEENYFFLMSKYHERLKNYINDNTDYIMPETRKNEVLTFLKKPLDDLCISRPKKRLSWGIELPFDKEFVTYVWFDALVNYYSATRYLAPSPNPSPQGRGIKNDNPSPLRGEGGGEGGWWPADVHLIGKDILTTHAVYWSTMLMALNLPLPKHIFAHGWWTVEGKKMSKSLGNVVDPGAMADKYGADAFRYFLFREVPFGLDGDFTEESAKTNISSLKNRYNSDLANDLGNLLSRTLTMIEKYKGGVIPSETNRGPRCEEGPLPINPRIYISSLKTAYQYSLSKFSFYAALHELWIPIDEANKYIQKSEPWVEKDPDVLSHILYTLAESLYQIAVYVYPFMPSSAQEIWRQLGIESEISNFKFADLKSWGNITPGTKINKSKALFPRIETLTKGNSNPPSPPFSKGGMGGFSVEPPSPQSPLPESLTPPLSQGERASGSAGEGENVISIDDFAKVELKTGKILFAERVPKSKKLIRLEVDAGEKRQVVAGIGTFYTPEELIGKNIVVVTNLKPAKLMGVESHGMLLAATDSDGKLSVLTLDRDVLPGARVK